MKMAENQNKETNMSDGSLLNSLDSLEDLKQLPLSKLPTLADDIRQRIIEVMAKNGGHLGSNLGTVELTIALHQVFGSPTDKFIWDVSHQTYTHKILTGRNARFDTVRQDDGLCGFAYPPESDHDHFQAGHAGTALAQGLGLARKRDLCNEPSHIIPIIGDATFTCGMAAEALNNITKDLKRFIVILNDNEMSISKNVGAVTRILNGILNSPGTNRLNQEMRNLLSKIPSCGHFLADTEKRVTESLKNLVSPAVFFEQYGLSYVGPIDGHNIHEMISVFEQVKDSPFPVILHCMTKKGNGLSHALKDAVTWHGPKPFDPQTGKFLPTANIKPTFPKIFGDQITKMAEEDESIVTVSPAMLRGSCLDDFHKRFPERCWDVGIAESHCVTYCGALAHEKKLKVVCSIYSTFLQRALDNLFHDVCLQENLPVVFCIDRGGLSAADGSTHHGIYDIAFLQVMPGMIICQPRDGQVLRELLNSAFSWDRPTAIRYPNLATNDHSEDLRPRALGRGELLRKGQGLLIISLGHMNQSALEVAEHLEKEHKIQATVFDPVFVKPLDEEALHQLLQSHDQVVTLEEHAVRGGLGSIFNSFLVENNYRDTQVLNLGIPDEFVGHGSHKGLLEKLDLTPKKITERILEHFSVLVPQLSNT